MDDNTNIDNTVTEATGAAVETGNLTDQETKTFTQEDVDRIIANRLKQVERKFEGIDIEEYQTLKSQQEQAREAEMMKKNQFEELLQKQKSEADSRITQLQNELQRVQIDGALLNAASKHKAVNPEHVAQLMKSAVRLNESGQVEVIDSDGNVRYDTNNALPVSVDQAVEEFLTQNAYFRTANPSGSGSSGNVKHTTSREVKLSDLDMSNPEHRKIFKEKYAVGNTRNFKTV
jgi:DNA-binding transcriptional regulator YbjK